MHARAALLVGLVVITIGCSDGAADPAADSSPASDDSSAVETGTGDAYTDAVVDSFVPETSTENKTVFVTSTTYTGDLGGVSGADAKCQTQAAAAMLMGSFKAWVSTASSSPASTFTRTSGDYILVDGTVVAHGWTGLTSGTLLHAINQTELKTEAPMTTPPCGAADANSSVWSGTLSNGTFYNSGFKPDRNCSDWTSAAAASPTSWGWPGATDGWWTQRCASAGGCDQTAALYCFEQ